MVANVGIMLYLPQKSEFRVANRCSKAKFATREVLAQLERGSQLLIFVANVGIMLHLPHKSEFRVANRCSKAKFATREVLAQLGQAA